MNDTAGSSSACDGNGLLDKKDQQCSKHLEKQGEKESEQRTLDLEVNCICEFSWKKTCHKLSILGLLITE